jgi:hypothetical protein
MSNLFDFTRKPFAITILLLVGLCNVADGAELY